MVVVEDVAVGMGGVVAVVDEFGVGADLAVVTLDELEDAEDASLVDGAESEGAASVGESFLNVLAEADGGFFEVFGFVVSDLPDDKVDEAYGEHVVGEKGELVFLGLVVRLKGIPEEGDVFLLLRGLEGEREVVGEFKGVFHGLLGFDCLGFFLAPDAGDGCLDLLIHPLNEFLVGGDELQLCIDLGNDRFSLRK